MATPTCSVPPVPQHILQAGQIVEGGFCGWVGVQVSLFVPSRPGETRMYERRLHACASTTSLYSVSCVEVVPSSGALCQLPESDLQS